MNSPAGIEKSLIIKQPWIDLILRGEKVWEMRSRATHIRGRIGLIEQGTGLIIGEGELVDCIAIDQLGISLNMPSRPLVEYHCVSDESLLTKYRFAWVIENPVRYETPIPYEHPKGAVIWVNTQSTF